MATEGVGGLERSFSLNRHREATFPIYSSSRGVIHVYCSTSRPVNIRDSTVSVTMKRFGSPNGRSSVPCAAFTNCFGAPKAKTGSDVVVETLADAGVDVCFVNPGTTEMWLVKSLTAEPRVRSVLALHETVCSGACDGYARMRRKPAACLLHMGPGFANGIANFHNAKKARSPVVAIVGDVATWHSGVDVPLNMDIEGTAAVSAFSRPTDGTCF